ncbi:MAG: Holliday junction branch migration protein RuvA [Firmicutes bacterium]|nr:Holliday junction branch migration protein RuvA [Bacillota bacterium]
MIHHIRGKIDGTIDGGIVVEANGIGYEVFIPDNSPLYLKKGNEEVKVLTVMIVKEDDVKLYGFSDKESMTVFRKLLTVSGVGAKGAMALLSAMPVNDLKQAIAFDDAATLTRANGIGKMIAQRICLELKDKLGDISTTAGVTMADINSADEKGMAVDALMALGYSRSEAAAALGGLEEGLSTEDYIKKALKKLF